MFAEKLMRLLKEREEPGKASYSLRRLQRPHWVLTT